MTQHYKVWDGAVMHEMKPLDYVRIFHDGSGALYDAEDNCIASFYPDYSQKLKGRLLRSTGLFDKNGKEIYEGDIVNMIYDEPKDRPHVVVWHKYKFIAIHTCEYNKFLDHQNEIHFSNTGKIPDSCDAEIIGNIHQNPELL